jgi:hypothetical protein
LGSFFSGPQGTIALSITVAALVAAGAVIISQTNTFTGSNFFNGIHTSIAHLELPNGQINYSNHILTLPLNTGTLLLSNQTLSSLTGTLGAAIGVTTLSNTGHISTFPGNTGILLQANSSGTGLSGILYLGGISQNITKAVNFTSDKKLTFFPNASPVFSSINLGCTTADPTTLSSGDIWCNTNNLAMKYQIGASKFFVATTSATASQTWANTVDRVTNSWIFNNSTFIIPGSGHGLAFTSQTQAANNTIIYQRTGTQTNNYVSFIGTRNFTTPGNPAGTTSTTGVMTGLLATLTPKYSDNMTITVSGDMASSALADGAKIDLRYQIGNTCSSNGIAITGTTVGNPLQVTAVNANADMYPFSITGYVTGLTGGTKYCIELGQYAITAGTATITNLSVFVTETQ